jgi:hypothetical protein
MESALTTLRPPDNLGPASTSIGAAAASVYPRGSV